MPGGGAAGQEPDAAVPRPVPGAAKAVRTAAEVVDQRVIPVAEELAEQADAGAAGVDAVVEVLRNGRRTGLGW